MYWPTHFCRLRGRQLRFCVFGLCLLSMLLSLSASPTAASTVTVSGTITGDIGGDNLNATLVGTVDTYSDSPFHGGSTGTEEVTFVDPVPTDLSVTLLGITITVYKCTVNSSSNSILELGNGTYDVARTWQFDGYPGAELDVLASVNVVGADLALSLSANGDVAPPAISATGISSYTALLTPNGPGSVLESIEVEMDNGQIARSTGEYTYAGDAMVAQYYVDVEWPTSGFTSTTKFEDTFQTTFRAVPEPSALAMWSCLAALGFVAEFRTRRLQVPLKSSASGR